MGFNYVWVLLSFNKAERSVNLKCNVDNFDMDDLADDINQLNLMAMENNGHSSDLHEDKEGNVTVKFIFSDDYEWKNFCNVFLKTEKEKEKDN